MGRRSLRALPFLVSLACTSNAAAQTYPLTQTPAMPPVPGSIRASCALSSFDGNGAGSCALANFVGGAAFTATPDCFAGLTAAVSGYVYAFPAITASTSSVTLTASAALKTLNVQLGATTFWGPAPAGTTITIFCRGS